MYVDGVVDRHSLCCGIVDLFVIVFFVRSLIVAVVYGAFIVVVLVALVAAGLMVRMCFLVRHTVFLLISFRDARALMFSCI